MTDPASTEQAASPSGLRYGDALAELEELLDELEDADIDVDHLAERVARGVELVRFCRERLSVVTSDVDQVVAELTTTNVGETVSSETNGHDATNGQPADEDQA